MDNPKGHINGFNITDYATDPTHEVRMSQLVYAHTNSLKTAEDIDKYIKARTPKSPVTGAMVISACDKFGIGQPGAALLVALIQNDSGFGTLGKGARTHNPGNVGNDDTGKLVDWGTWQAGVDAVARWLSRHRVQGG